MGAAGEVRYLAGLISRKKRVRFPPLQPNRERIMANDRLYIVCPCGAWSTMWKYYPGAGFFREECNNFLNEHVLACGANGEMPLFFLLWENQVNRIVNLEKQNARPPGQ